MEDGCQVLSRPPADKYLIGTEQVLGALTGLCDACAVAARTLLQQLVFAYLSGNGDAHAKNFSVRQNPDGEWRVSPAYDLPSSQPYGDTTMAMSVAGRTASDLGRADFPALATTLGLRERAAQRVLSELTDRVELWLDDLPELPFGPDRVDTLRRVVAYRRHWLRR
ncbi:MAG: hypothetical protein NVSMB13_19180 [Mycobacteriales bacterium]